MSSNLTYHKNLDMISAIKLMDTSLTNREHDVILNGPQHDTFKNNYPCWTGTLIAYCSGRLPEFFYEDGYGVKVPKQYRGMQNVALVAEGPLKTANFKHGIELIPKKWGLVLGWPEKDGWYLPDAHGIPTETPSDIQTPEARYLYTQNQYVGLLVRGTGVFYLRRSVVAYWSGPSRFGVMTKVR